MGRIWKCALVMLCALAGCRQEPVPAALIHVWRTDAPAYQDRHLEIRAEWLVFGTSAYGADLYPIVDLDSEPAEAGGTLYTIHYRADDGAHLQLRLVLKPGPPDSLRIEHLDEIWLAESTSARARKGV
jgi:hypothetical protein